MFWIMTYMYMYVTTDLDAFQESILFENSIHDNVPICQSRSHTSLYMYSTFIILFLYCENVCKLQCTMYDDSGEP